MLNTEVVSINIVLENCEYFTFERKHIGQFNLSKIERVIGRYGSNYIGEFVYAKSVQIEIKSDANIETKSISGKLCLPFKRIVEHKDITSIELIYENGEKEVFQVDYEETVDFLGAPNVNQSCKYNEFGDLYIVIENSIDVDFYFPD